MKDNIDTVKLSQIEKVIEKVKKNNPEVEDMDVTFEFVIASLFPRAYYNILDRIKKEKTESFFEGYKSAKEEEKNEN